MPSESPRQHRFMEMIAHDPKAAKRVGVPQSVGRDFVAADKAGHKFAHGGVYRLHHEDADAFHVVHPDGEVRVVPKKGAPRAVLAAMALLPRIEPERMADGGPVSPAEEMTGPADLPMAVPPAMAGNVPSAEEQFVGEPSTSVTPEMIAAGAPPAAIQGVPPMLAKPPDAAPGAAAPTGSPPPQPGSDGGGAGLSFPQIPSYPAGALEGRIAEMEKTGREGAELQSTAQAQQAQEMTGAYQDYLGKLSDTEQARQRSLQAVQQEIDSAIADVRNQHIDPARFWSSRTAAQRTTATIGLVLGGIGSGLTGQPNAALSVIDRAIDRDVDAQRAELGKKENLVTQLYRKYGNVEEAASAARSYLAASVAGQAGLAAARSGNLQAQAAAKLLESHFQAQALGPMAQVVNGKYQADMARYNMEWQQRIWGMVGPGAGATAGGNGAVYLPSAHSANVKMQLLGGPDKYARADSEQRVQGTLPSGKPFYTHAGSKEQAAQLNDSTAEQETMLNLLDRAKQIVARGSTRRTPGTQDKAEWDALKFQVGQLMPTVMANSKRFNNEEVEQAGEKLLGGGIGAYWNDPARVASLEQSVRQKRINNFASMGVRFPDPLAYATAPKLGAK